ncbi:MAG: hypothetical protein JSV80_16825 [Acidobacteriota bacterium]|nr:MAG: hypothetical protein JSV80_16825 [Acidobacteriota bacterium]
MTRWIASARGHAALARLAARQLAGRWSWVLALLPVSWIGWHYLRLAVGWRPERFEPEDVPAWLIGLPLAVLATGLGVRIIGAEIDRRTLEIAYTVPGGSQRIWWAKLLAAGAVLLAAEGLLALATFSFLTEFPAWSLYAAWQAAVFYLVLAMVLSAWFKSEVTAALLAMPLVILGIATSGTRFSPLWNAVQYVESFDRLDLLAWSVQNHVGYALMIAALIALAFQRAENREKMLAG